MSAATCGCWVEQNPGYRHRTALCADPMAHPGYGLRQLRSRSPHERSDMRGYVWGGESPGYRFAHPGYDLWPVRSVMRGLCFGEGKTPDIAIGRRFAPTRWLIRATITVC